MPYNEREVAYDGLHEVAEAIRYLADKAFPPKPQYPDLPDPVTVKEEHFDMADFLHKQQQFSSLDGTDAKFIHYRVDGATEAVALKVEKVNGAFPPVEFIVPQDDEFTVKWAVEDEAGNVTPFKQKTLVAVDDWAGNAPDEIGPIVTTGEHSE